MLFHNNTAIYLKYWWDANSIIDTNKYMESYYLVSHDIKNRPSIVICYNSHNVVEWISKIHWKNRRMIRTERYNPEGTLQYYNIYRYNWYGKLLGFEHYSPIGRLLRFESRRI